MSKELIVKEIMKSCGSEERASLELIADTESGESYFLIEKTIIQRVPLKEYDYAIELYKKLTRGGGRRVYTLEDLTK
jgi:hypothetical protein